MKLIILCFVLLSIRLTFTRKVKSMIKLDYITISPIQEVNSRNINDFVDMASLGYCHADDFASRTCGYLCDTAFKGWENIYSKTYSNEYDFSIFVVRSLEFKKIIISFSGTKHNTQLADEAWNSGSQIPKGFEQKNIQIMSYFLDLYNKIKKDLHKNTKGAINLAQINGHQIIITGHSLGGAMAGVYSFFQTQKGNIKRIEYGSFKSPILITFGSPRAGNWAFANEIVKNVPKFFRFVNKYDPVASLPTCVQNEHEQCINEYNRNTFDQNYTNYKHHTLTGFYPWHLPGLIVIHPDTKKVSFCMHQSENSIACTYNDSEYEVIIRAFSIIGYHTEYFGKSIGSLCAPKENNEEYFNYLFDSFK